MNLLLLDLVARVTMLTISISVFIMAFPFPGRARELAAAVFFEIRWLWLPCAVYRDIVFPILQREPIRPMDWLIALIDLGMWWLIYQIKDDDDRWRKRGRKAADAVRRAGARLVVVPQTA